MATRTVHYRCDDCSMLHDAEIDAELCEEKHESERNRRDMKIGRNRSTPEGRAFWDHVEKCSAEVATWPDWKKASINYEQPGVDDPRSRRKKDGG
jgi:hypothetical protein